MEVWRIPEKTVNNGVRTAVQKECATILTPTQRPVVQQVTSCTRAFPTLVLQVTSLGKSLALTYPASSLPFLSTV